MELKTGFKDKIAVVTVQSILDALDKEIQNGNTYPAGFSAAIFLSDLRRQLEKIVGENRV